MPLHKMELEGVISETNWSSYSATEQSKASEIMAHLFDTSSQSEQDQEELPFGAPSLFWPDQCLNPHSYYGNDSPFVYNWSQGNCSIEYESYFLNDSNESIGFGVCSQSAPMDLSFGQEQHRSRNLCMIPNSPLKDCFFLNGEMPSKERGDSSMNLLESVSLSSRIAQPKRKFSIGSDEMTAGPDMLDASVEIPEKKARVTQQARKCTKKAESKRNQKSGRRGDEEESNPTLTRQDSVCCSSDDDSNASQESNGSGGSTSPSSKRCSALNLSGKTKSGRASATDSQSLYARKRRERINERLRILQNLVPNGTKVDISTMLDEAVHYVKFLQLQIKLLSSDELWMYAPIAFNGINVGIDLKISPNEKSN